MHLKRATIENFRGVKQLALELDSTTVLIGENNTGKTSILDAIRFCLSRPLSRRGNPFEDHDYLLATDRSKPGDSGKLVIRLEFAESTKGEWPPEIIQSPLGDVIVVHADGLRHITFQVTSEYSTAARDFVFDWDFLDAVGKPMPKGKRPQNVAELQRTVPVYYLSALRDAAREFQSHATFWAPFLRSPAIPQTIQDQLEKELAQLNDKILNAEPRLGAVKKKLGKTHDVVTVGAADTVGIDALPTRVWEMLSRAQVNVAAPTGAKLPLIRHGAGTQSLCVLFLFEAFLDAGLGGAAPSSSPILQLEEPEAHLHPAAVRALWSTLQPIMGQKIITTHSGDLLSEVPLQTVRRLRRHGGTIEVKQLAPTTLNPDELRKIHYHVRRTRGELLFAKCWMLVEGETEYWVFSGAAEASGLDLEKLGIRIVEYTNIGAVSLAKCADDFGIEWHAVMDADQAGQNVARSLRPILGARQESGHLSILPHPDMETMLCSTGFHGIYERRIPTSHRGKITAKVGDPTYVVQLRAALPAKYKTACAFEVCDELKKGGAKTVPKALADILQVASKLAQK